LDKVQQNKKLGIPLMIGIALFLLSVLFLLQLTNFTEKNFASSTSTETITDSSFSNTSNWLISDGGGLISIFTLNETEVRGVKVSLKTPSWTWLGADYSSSWNLTDKEIISFWFRSDFANQKSGTCDFVIFDSSGNHRIYFFSHPTINTWSKVSRNIKNYDVQTSTAPDLNNIVKFRIAVKAEGATINFGIANVAFENAPDLLVDPLTYFRVVPTIFLVFLPGLSWSYFFFKKKQISCIERVMMSFALSIVLVPLTIFVLNVWAGVRITFINSALIVAVLSAIPVFVYLSKKTIFAKILHGSSNQAYFEQQKTIIDHEPKDTLFPLHIKCNRTELILILVFLFSVVVRMIPFLISDFLPPAWDPVRLSENVEYIIRNGRPELSVGTFSNQIYPFSEILVFFFYDFTQIVPYRLMVIMSIFLGGLISIFAFITVRAMGGNNNHALFSAFFASVFTTDLRMVTFATIFTISGQILFWTILWGIQKYNGVKSKMCLVLLFFLGIALALIHQLTFFVMLGTLFLFGLSKVRSRKSILYFVVLGIMSLIIGRFALVSLSPYGGYDIFKFTIIMLYANNKLSSHEFYPISDYPSFWGYTIAILGVYGLIRLASDQKLKLRGLIFALFLFSIFMANTLYLGLVLIPYRFLFYASFPLIIVAPLGLEKILKTAHSLDRRRILHGLIVVLVIVSATLHGIQFAISDYKLLGRIDIPKQYDIEAMTWIKCNAPENATILATNYGSNYSTLVWMKTLANRNCLYSLMPITDDFNLNPSFENDLLPKGIIGYILSPFLTQEIKREKLNLLMEEHRTLADPYFIFKYPDTQEAMRVMDKYNVLYAYIYDGSAEDKKLATSLAFKLVYQNDEVKIYERYR